MGCVYIATCLPTGKYYIGKTVKPLTYRWSEHKHAANTAADQCPRLHRAMRKYGSDTFVVESLSESSDKQALVELEKLWIILLDARAIGMNLTSGGDGTPGCRRPPMSESLRKAFDRTGKAPWNKGKRGYKLRSYNVRYGSDNPFFGRRHSAESKLAMRAAKLGAVPWNKKEGERWPSGKLKRKKK